MALGGEIRGSDSTMVHAHMILGNIVALVGWTGPPKVSELCLGGTAAEPVESHVHQFEALAGDVVHDNA